MTPKKGALGKMGRLPERQKASTERREKYSYIDEQKRMHDRAQKANQAWERWKREKNR